jgi:DNA polymerase-4
MLRNPRLREVPFAVCGRKEQRHGIVLTANYLAKNRGVKTGMANWEAEKVCPGLLTVPPRFNDYVQFSGFVRKIYGDYTGNVEPFGLDESWLDLTGCVRDFDDGTKLVNELRERVKRELGLSVSIGLADNKVIAKLGSDMKKPDACTIIPRERMRELVWPLPVGDLLYVGRATQAKLNGRGIRTIGDLAVCDPENLRLWLGKIGSVLHAFANGDDRSEVAPIGFESAVKSVGNSFTCPRDLESDQDVKIMTIALAESVGARLMELGFCAGTVEFSFVSKDRDTHGSRQRKLESPTCLSKEIADIAFDIYKHSDCRLPFRKIGVRACYLVSIDSPRQLNLWQDPKALAKAEELERSVNVLRQRYGNKIIQRGIMYLAPELSAVDAKKDHTIHPVGVFSNGVTTEWGGYTK